jgi:hypothetical protein
VRVFLYNHPHNKFHQSYQQKNINYLKSKIFPFYIYCIQHFIAFFVYSEQVSLSEPPTKIAHYEQFDSSSHRKKIRKSRHKPLSKVSIENTTPNHPPLTASIGVDTTGIILSKKRSSAEIAAAAILSSNHMRKKRVQRKHSDEINANNNNIKQESISINDSPTEIINDELLKRLSQGKRK